LAQFLACRGHRVFEALGTAWGYYRGSFLCSLPFHKPVDAKPGEIRDMLWKHSLRSVRFPSACGRGIPCGLYVCRPREYSMKSLRRRFRRLVNRGMAACEIRPVEPDRLLREGLQLNLDTMLRQNRYDPEFGDTAAWRRFVEALRQSPGIAVTGAFVRGRLSAYVITCTEDSCLQILYKMARESDRHLSIGHALDYQVVTEAGRNPAIDLVVNSFTSLVPNKGLDSYKRHMGFTIEPHHLEIHFHPVLAPLVTSKVAVRVATTLWQRCSQSAWLELTAKVLDGARTTTRK
jgi:hypothetical protein